VPLKVAIVEDNAELCEELQLIVGDAADMTCVAACRNAATALAKLPKAQPDVTLMDIRLPDGSGVELVQRLTKKLPQTQFIMLTMYQDDQHIFDALAAGAIGYLIKDASEETIIKGIKDAYQGHSPLSGVVARKVVQKIHSKSAHPPKARTLTARERDVIELVSQGLPDKQIADQLGISLLTVNSHLKNIYSKLGVHSRAEAISKYFLISSD